MFKKKYRLFSIITVVKVFFAGAVTFLAIAFSNFRPDKPEKNCFLINDDGRIFIGNKLTDKGKQIWINGVNTPWDRWNDFGGEYREWWWNEEFSRLREAGINATRVWINCNGLGSITIDSIGNIHGASAKHWDDLDSFFALAKKHKIYIMATLTSFDHFKTNNHHSNRWRAMIRSKSASESFAKNYTIPFVERYRDIPYLWSIDIMNEPEWISEGQEDNILQDRISWDDISYFFAVNAAAIHENSKALVTVGIAYPKWNVDAEDSSGDYRGNKVSDPYLQRLYPNRNAYLDFWSPHYYDWVGEWYGVPFYLPPDGKLIGNRNTGWTGGWGLDPSKPALIGECSAKGTRKDYLGLKNNSIITDYEQAYLNGWQGVMAWTSNAVDGNGGLYADGNRTTHLKLATQNMLEKYRILIYPLD